MKPRILVVDDELSIREFLQIMLQKEDYDVSCAEDGLQALETFQKRSFDLIISDLQMPNMTGIELLKKVKNQDPTVLFLMITAFGSTETAVEAMKLGAYDYITKPFKIDEVRINIQNALSRKFLEQENKTLKRELGVSFESGNFIGSSHTMQEIFSTIERVSQTTTSILITGESGTGKELVAHSIHNKSPFKNKPFVTVNCGALPENLIESELFGHKKGSFTGAHIDKKGLFEAANGGTLFLDEVGELPPPVQVKLLRALQEKTIRQVGATEDIHVDVRIITATNRNLESMMKKGQFRQDLYYRLNVIKIACPPLRERKEDIPLLCDFFLKKFNKKFNKEIVSLGRDALEVLTDYDFPGNVRELENIIERSVALEGGNILLAESLPPFIQTTDGIKIVSAQEVVMTKAGIDLEKILGQLERELLMKAIHTAGGVKKRAAGLLNISFRSMRYRAEKYQISCDDDDEEESGSDALSQ